MKITPINNYPQYSKTNFQSKNNGVSFGAIQDDKTRSLMRSMGMDPKNSLYEIYPLVLYTEGNKLKGRLRLAEPHKQTIARWHTQDALDDYVTRLKSHDYTFNSKELVDAYFEGFKKLFYPEYTVVTTPDDTDHFVGR